MARYSSTKAKSYGVPVKIINTTGNDWFCEWTGKKLPRRGMAWLHDGKYFLNQSAAKAWDEEET